MTPEVHWIVGLLTGFLAGLPVGISVDRLIIPRLARIIGRSRAARRALLGER